MTINIIKGDNVDLVITAQELADSTAINLNSVTAIVFNMKQEGKASALITKDLTDGIEKTTPASGILTVSLLDTDTASLNVGDYIFEVVFTDDGGKINTLRTADLSFPLISVSGF